MFTAANNISQFNLSRADGVLGLGLPQLTTLPGAPFVEAAFAQKAISSPVFAFHLSSTTGSEFHLGGVNTSLFNAAEGFETHNVSAISPGFWQLSGTSVSVAGSKAASGFEAIIDSSTTIMFGSPALVKNVYAKIPGSKPVDPKQAGGFVGFYSIPCGTDPKLSFAWGGKEWPISAQE